MSSASLSFSWRISGKRVLGGQHREVAKWEAPGSTGKHREAPGGEVTALDGPPRQATPFSAALLAQRLHGFRHLWILRLLHHQGPGRPLEPRAPVPGRGCLQYLILHRLFLILI